MKSVATMLLALTFLLLSACSGDDETSSDVPESRPREEGRYYASGYSIRWPEDWNEQDGSFLSPDGGDEDLFIENARVLLVPLGDESLDELAQSVVDQMAGGMSNFRMLSEEPFELDGNPGKLLIAESTDPGLPPGTKARSVIYLVQKDDQVGSIIFTALDTTYDEYQEQFEEIARSFRFE